MPWFVADVREAWARTERTVGGTAPDLSDDAITAIGVAMCDHLGTVAMPGYGQDNDLRMTIYSELAAIATDAMVIDHDPGLQDAGFENELEARNVMAFKFVAEGGLCVPPTSYPCAFQGCLPFAKPWSARASA